jgi:uncharacterized protein
LAVAIASDPDHTPCVALFEDQPDELVVPQLVVAEAGYLVGRIVGGSGEAAFLRALVDGPLSFVAFEAADLRRAAELLDIYADLRIGTVDAVVIATAERLGATRIATLDRRHFSVVRPAHTPFFELLP